MERVLFAIGVGIGKLLMVIVELIFYAITTRRPKQTALSLPLPVRFEHTHIVAGSGMAKRSCCSISLPPMIFPMSPQGTAPSLSLTARETSSGISCALRNFRHPIAPFPNG